MNNNVYKTDYIIAIDPGKITGVAVYDTLNNVCSLGSFGNENKYGFLQAVNFLTEYKRLELSTAVIVEDSTQMPPYNVRRSGNGLVMFRKGRGVGEVDAQTKILIQLCDELQLPCYRLAPKGAKLSTEAFEIIAPSIRVNQHARDAYALLKRKIIHTPKILKLNR